MWKDFTTEDFERGIERHIQSQRHPRVDIVIRLKPFVAERLKSVKAQLAGRKRGFVPRQFKPPFGGDFPPPKAFIELARQLKRAEELIDRKTKSSVTEGNTDTKQAMWVIEHATGALKNLGKRLGGPKGEEMDKASRQLFGFREEIAGGGFSTQKANEIKKLLKQTRQMVEKAVPTPIPDELNRKLDELHRLMDEKIDEGLDITEAKKLDDKSKEYVQRGDMKGAINLVSKAIDLLKQQRVLGK